jgi:phage/plasmid-associated DNA primase
MFPSKRVAVLAANHEKTFGLQTWVNARIILAPDIPDKMHKVLGQTIWQAMVTGESVSVPRKNKDALDLDAWPVPLFWAGNHLPSFSDNAGSTSRRLAVFRFQTLIKTRDTSLMGRIERGELVAVMIRCLRQYHKARQQYAGRDFWAFAPVAMKEARDDAAEETLPGRLCQQRRQLLRRGV